MRFKYLLNCFKRYRAQEFENCYFVLNLFRSWKVAGSISDEVIGFFDGFNLPAALALRLIQPVTTRKLPAGAQG
jgi:hypothetical protein